DEFRFLDLFGLLDFFDFLDLFDFSARRGQPGDGDCVLASRTAALLAGQFVLDVQLRPTFRTLELDGHNGALGAVGQWVDLPILSALPGRLKARSFRNSSILGELATNVVFALRQDYNPTDGGPRIDLQRSNNHARSERR